MVTEIDSQRIVSGFLDHTLPAEEWTHMAHLVMGLYMAEHYDLDESIKRLRTGIQTFNLAKGGVNSDTVGYHETITVFFAHAMQTFTKQLEEGLSLEEKVGQLNASVLVSPKFMFSFFSKDCLFSVQARRGWVDPDLRPLSEVNTADFFDVSPN